MRVIIVTLGIVALGAYVNGAVITLKSGQKFTGKIVQESKTEVQMETAPGAVLTFPREQIESIEGDAAPTPTIAAPPSSEAAMPATDKDFRELQAQVATLQSEVAKLKEEVAKLKGATAEVAARAQQIPAPLGDQPGDAPSKLELVNMRWSRAGDNIKVEGAIRNSGGSPGKWVRVIAVVKDRAGNIIGKGETTPAVASPGLGIRDMTWVVPGKDLPITVFVPFGGWSKNSTFTSTTEVAKRPRQLPRLSEIVVEWKLEVPPKFSTMPEVIQKGQDSSQTEKSKP